MLGAIIGDIVGSRFEWHNYKAKDFVFLNECCCMTDDSYMTLAVAEALLAREDDDQDLSRKAIMAMQRIGQAHRYRGFGGHFMRWIFLDDPQPYGSYGNGAAMRVSACGFVAESVEQAKQLALAVTRVSHDHPESLKAAVAISVAIYMARHGSTMEEIRELINKEYYQIDFTLDEIRDAYTFDVSCQGSVPQAFEAFFESTDFEDAIRNAISIGGDSDTIAAITGGIAEAYYGIPEEIRERAWEFIEEPELCRIVTKFEREYPTKNL